jgi:hypothetical protein
MKIDPQNHTIRFGDRDISFTLRRNGRKSLKIVVTPELNVEVVAPHEATDEQILSAVHKKAPWIARKLDQQASYHPLPSPRQYISGETLVYLGRQYRLQVATGTRPAAKLVGGFLEVEVEDKSDRRSVKRVVEEWYRQRAHQIIDRYLEKCRSITLRHGVPEPKLMIRGMLRRWGSCSPAGRITLNLKLVQVPVHCIEYVIMHELCHLKHHNHSKAFYSLLTRCQPDWQKRKAALDRFRLS